MSWSDKIQQIDQQVAGSVRDALTKAKEELDELLRASRDELSQRLEGTLSALPSSFVGADALEPLAKEAKNEGRDEALGGLRDAVALLDQQRTQASILESLLESAGRFASRAALFLTTSDGVRGWGAAGFGDNGDRIHGVRFEYDEGSSWSRLRDGGGAIEASAGERASLGSLMESEVANSAVLIPLVLRDRIAAALYADATGDGEMLIEALQILVHSAGLSIETLPFRSRAATPTLMVGAAAATLSVWESQAEAQSEPEASEPEATEAAEEETSDDSIPEPEAAEPAEESPAAPEPADEAAPLAFADEESPAEPEKEDTLVQEAPAAEEDSESPGLQTSSLDVDTLVPGAPSGFESDEAASPLGAESAFVEEPEPFRPSETLEAPTDDDSSLLGGGPTEISVQPESQSEELFTPEATEPEEEVLTPSAFGQEASAEEVPAPEIAQEIEVEADETVLLSSSHFAEAPSFSEPEPEPEFEPEPEPEQTVEAEPEPPSLIPTPTFTPEKITPPEPPAFEAPSSVVQPPPEVTPVMPSSPLDDPSETRPRLHGSAQVAPPEDVAGPGAAFARKAEVNEDDATFQEGRRLARLLVSEIRLYNEEQVEEGKRNRDILRRLREDIERSRKMYEERVDPQVLESADYFQEELVRILAGGDAGALGE